MTILFEDTVHLEAAMPFWKLQFDMNYQTGIYLLSVHMVAMCTAVVFIYLIRITAHKKYIITSFLLRVRVNP